MINFLRCALGLTVLCVSSTSIAAPSSELKSKFSSIGNIKEVRETDTKGMYAWMLEKNGKTLVLYNTPDNKYFIKGSIYNIDSKQLVSNADAIDSLKYASKEFRDKVLHGGPLGSTPTTQSTLDDLSKIGLMNLQWNHKKVPEALKLIDDLPGAKQGKGLPQDTLYIFYDPTCVWCHRSFSAIQPYIDKGFTVKWLPTFALGKNETSIALASAPLQNPSLLKASFDKELSALNVKATPKNINDIDSNLQFLIAYVNKVEPGSKVGVPFGLMLDKKDNKVTHIKGLHDKNTLSLIFGDK